MRWKMGLMTALSGCLFGCEEELMNAVDLIALLNTLRELLAGVGVVV